MKQWKVKTADERIKEELSKELGLSNILSLILVNRNITNPQNAHKFLYSTLPDLYDWRLLADIQKASARIKKAIFRKEKILIYGDYDVDGVSATALLLDVFAKLGADVTYYIPDRMEEGYGLNRNVFHFAKKEGSSLIVTVDCGISAFEEVEFLNKCGIEVIITDHHEQKGKELPRALAIVCPHRFDCNYPFKELSGVAVAFKLAQAVCEEREDLSEYLDLVSLGTIADVVPLVDENRILVKEGLKKFSATKRKGLRALINVSGLRDKDISARHIAFILGPRINASGRIGSADAALRLLMTDDEKEAEILAAKLHNSNRQRQKMQEKVLNEALAKIESEVNFKEHRVIVLEGEDWHPGIIGIVASRITKEFHRPTIIISTKDSPGKGSGRSIKNFHLFEAIDKSQHLLINYGGHEAACGISILKDKIKTFSSFINEIAHEALEFEDLLPTIEIDAEIPLHQVSVKLINEIDQLVPFGAGNPEPILLSRGLSFKNAPIRFGKNNFKGWVTDEEGVCEAVGFGMACDLDLIANRKFDIVYYPYLSRWGGIETARLSLKDVRLSE